jgi:hypothetical protein
VEDYPIEVNPQEEVLPITEDLEDQSIKDNEVIRY